MALTILAFGLVVEHAAGALQLMVLCFTVLCFALHCMAVHSSNEDSTLFAHMAALRR